MRKEYIIEEMGNSRWFLTFIDTNEKGEKVTIEISKLEDDPSFNKSLPKLWKQHGYIDRVLETRWNVETYVKDTEGNSFGRYNPQHKLSDDGQRAVINFDWMFEATEENKEKLIDEIYRLASSAKGETATEKKNRKIREYAKENSIDIVTTIPEGWEIVNRATAPVGTVWISNMETWKSKNLKYAILSAN